MFRLSSESIQWMNLIFATQLKLWEKRHQTFLIFTTIVNFFECLFHCFFSRVFFSFIIINFHLLLITKVVSLVVFYAELFVSYVTNFLPALKFLRSFWENLSCFKGGKSLWHSFRLSPLQLFDQGENFIIFFISKICLTIFSDFFGFSWGANYFSKFKQNCSLLYKWWIKIRNVFENDLWPLKLLRNW